MTGDLLMDKIRILILEDVPEDAELEESELHKAGMDCTPSSGHFE